MNIAPPLFIAGCPRSGTSLTAKAFEACGAWTGGTSSLCENMRLKNEILKPMLRAGGMDQLALQSFADVQGDPVAVREKVEEILTRQKYPGGPWLFKDVKLVFCWETWAEAFPDAIWATVWRYPDAIRESFGRWGLARKVSFDFDQVIEEHHSRARVIPGVCLYPDRLIVDEDDSGYRYVAEQAGITWDRAKVDQVVDPSKYHAGMVS